MMSASVSSNGGSATLKVEVGVGSGVAVNILEGYDLCAVDSGVSWNDIKLRRYKYVPGKAWETCAEPAQDGQFHVGAQV